VYGRFVVVEFGIKASRTKAGLKKARDDERGGKRKIARSENLTQNRTGQYSTRRGDEGLNESYETTMPGGERLCCGLLTLCRILVKSGMRSFTLGRLGDTKSESFAESKMIFLGVAVYSVVSRRNIFECLVNEGHLVNPCCRCRSRSAVDQYSGVDKRFMLHVTLTNVLDVLGSRAWGF
jgi:hypothetical protein